MSSSPNRMPGLKLLRMIRTSSGFGVGAGALLIGVALFLLFRGFGPGPGAGTGTGETATAKSDEGIPTSVRPDDSHDSRPSAAGIGNTIAFLCFWQNWCARWAPCSERRDE